jgi:hypothetical protein
LKKPTGLVRFRFYKPKTVKTKLNRTQTRKTRAKPEKTESNRFELVFVLKNQTETGRFEPVSVFLKKIGLIIFFIKTKSNKKIITPN